MRRSIDPRSLIATLALGAGALAYLFFSFLPGKREIDSLHGQLVEKQDYVLRLSRLIATRPPTEQELSETRAYIDQTQNSIPDEDGLAALMLAISDQAERAGVTLLRVDPQAREPLATLAKAPMTVACQGSFSQLHAFFAGLERSPFILWTDSLSLQPAMPGSPVLICEWKLCAFTAETKDAVPQQQQPRATSP
jgi:Tfp pilus assembly protein PilO